MLLKKEFLFKSLSEYQKHLWELGIITFLIVYKLKKRKEYICYLLQNAVNRLERELATVLNVTILYMLRADEINTFEQD